MLQIFIQSFVRAEVTIGIVLTVLLISGRNDPQSIAFSLGGLGMFFLLHGMLPLSRRRPLTSQPTSKNERSRTSKNERSQTSAEDEESSSDARQPAASNTACSKKPFRIGTACLIYWFAPPLA